MYHVFLDDVEFPIAPASITTTINGKNDTLSLIDDGEINVIKTTGLTTISFDLLLPNSKYPFAGGSIFDSVFNGFGFKNASYYLNKVKHLKTAKTPCRLLIVRHHFNHAPLWHTSMLVTIENYTIKDTTEEGVDNVLSLDLKQYKPYGTKEIITSKDASGNPVYTVKDNRYTPPTNLPTAIKVVNQSSVLEAVEGLRAGLNWREIAVSSGLTNPLSQSIKGAVIPLVKR